MHVLHAFQACLNGVGYALRRCYVQRVFVGIFGSHVYIGVAKLHLALHRCACREVKLVYVGGLRYGGNVLLVYATARQENDAALGLLVQLFQ